MRRRTHRRQVYPLVWSVLCGLIVVLGLMAGLFLVSTDVLFVLLFIGAMIGATVASSRWSKARDTTRAAKAWKAVGTVATVIAVMLASAGYAVLLGPAGPFLLVILGAASPPAMRWFGRRLGHLPGRRRSGALTTAELCRHWQDSYEALRQATTAAARLRIVEARQHYLDELERRDPHGLNAWLSRNASAAGDPSRFLTGGDPH
ncbi:adenosylcobinamide-GDP ribazoletransferase [Kribbella jiaozuonensis]|uniref:Uncharacterized protein n=1 Tax=Kribbella jiaozuonensis TaxID=2575441 RepID=A0A4U3M209_9ACTN|nr:hypothetical protein [Kribbella jiaozuonensis]TKK82755.1 hypothetical protein FDA38_08340 [Kribbella jiaozuonensis]